MAVGSEKRIDHFNGFKSEIQKASEVDDKTFFNWFDESGGTTETSFLRGKNDFVFYILMPVLPYFKEVSTKIALEIGYGGGRLLAEAAKSFKQVIGVDIHENGAIVKRALQHQQINNIELIKNKGNDIPVKKESVDLVYSFIVLQHIEKIDNFHAYLKDTFTVLKQGGIAILFFGRLSTKSAYTDSQFWYKIDLLIEKFHSKGYKEIVTEVNNVNLKISLKYAKKAVEKLGFKVLKSGVSRKLPDFEKFGGQHFLMIQK